MSDARPRVFKTLRAEIRAVVDDAESRLTANEIWTAIAWRTTKACFSVTLCTMVDAKQLRKRKAPKSKRSAGVRWVYGPGAAAVVDSFGQPAARPRKMLGFMEMAREREKAARPRARERRRAA